MSNESILDGMLGIDAFANTRGRIYKPKYMDAPENGTATSAKSPSKSPQPGAGDKPQSRSRARTLFGRKKAPEVS